MIGVEIGIRMALGGSYEVDRPEYLPGFDLRAQLPYFAFIPCLATLALDQSHLSADRKNRDDEEQRHESHSCLFHELSKSSTCIAVNFLSGESPAPSE